MALTTELRREGNDYVELGNDFLRCEIVPGVGGAISGLWFRDIPVLRCVPAMELQSPRKGGCFGLLPYSNRIGRGELHWRGETYILRTTQGDEPHAIHGVGWQRAWRVVDQDACHVQLTYEHQADDCWPFPFLASQTISIDGSNLLLKLTYCNTSHEAAPVGLGWHPYFVKRADAHLAFQTKGMWETAPDKLPTHRIESLGFLGNCADLTVDHCYDGWKGMAELRDEKLCIRISSDTNYLVTFTHPGVDFIAIEPVSHISNAQQLAAGLGVSMISLGLRELGANQVAQLEVKVRISATDKLFTG